MVTLTPLKEKNKEFGNSRPQRGMGSILFAMAAELDSGWFDKEFMGIVSLHAMLAHTAITAQVWGRFDNNAATEHRIGDKDGANILLNLDQGADGTSFILDAAAACDQVKFIFSANVTGDFVLGLGA